MSRVYFLRIPSIFPKVSFGLPKIGKNRVYIFHGMAKYFQPAEFACRCGCGLSKADPKLVEILDSARIIFGRPIIVASGTRCEKHNAAIGGAKKSAHLIGPDGFSHAVDIRVLDDFTRWHLFQIFERLGILRFEVSNLHLHIDNADYLPHPILAGTFFKEKGEKNEI